eukprot:Ihof_evm1s1362 gene=Ihof_evmTU1s1362
MLEDLRNHLQVYEHIKKSQFVRWEELIKPVPREENYHRYSDYSRKESYSSDKKCFNCGGNHITRFCTTKVGAGGFGGDKYKTPTKFSFYPRAEDLNKGGRPHTLLKVPDIFKLSSNKDYQKKEEQYARPGKSSVTWGDGRSSTIEGTGTIRIQGEDRVVEIKNVDHVPELHESLVSVGKLHREKWDLTFVDNGIMVGREGKVVMKGHLNSKEIDAKGDSQCAVAVQGRELTYSRYMHPGTNIMKEVLQ